ncbi:hypothetical protein B1B07_12670 [Kocuria marina subsp. indica]|uniref:Uncharacterized protein n=1 Tax=Kocuria marina subsp. indica TaxID=1049583 RepID=A0A1X7EDN6_9MICC|nr:hypothetical protein B1B07_12670 [Kocuria indica]SMF32122.1 hypothetical protein SAMN06296028_1311 [Kocuria indica]
MRRVGTFIFGRPRPLSGDRRADPNYTLICEEPLYLEDGVHRALRTALHHRSMIHARVLEL